MTPFKKYVNVQLVLISAVAASGIIEQYWHGHHYPNSIMPYTGELFDVAGLLAFTSVVVHLAFQFRFNWQYRFITTAAILALYLSSYSLLSVCGKYHASRSGMNRWNQIGMAVVDQDLWHAKGVFWQPFVTVDGKHTFQATFVGYFYSPLICIDRGFVHKTVKLFDTMTHRSDSGGQSSL